MVSKRLTWISKVNLPSSKGINMDSICTMHIWLSFRLHKMSSLDACGQWAVVCPRSVLINVVAILTLGMSFGKVKSGNLY